MSGEKAEVNSAKYPNRRKKGHMRSLWRYPRAV